MFNLRISGKLTNSFDSNPGRFCGTAKLHKLPPNDTMEGLPIRPIASNIGTASYHLAKYLAHNLSPLGQSTYTIKSTLDLMGKIKNEQLHPRLHEHVKKWKHFVDDTFAYVRNESIDYVLTTLNSFNPDLNVTYEKENNSQLLFLDVLFIRNGTHLDTKFTEKIPIII